MIETNSYEKSPADIGKAVKTTVADVEASIAYCGLVCVFCHIAGSCGGCKSNNNICSKYLSESGCFQHDCCIKKGIAGCWECGEFPCGRDMFGEGHDIRLRAFVRLAKEEGTAKLAEYVLRNQLNGITYGHNRDYDNLGDEEKVLDLLRTGKRQK